MLQPERNRKLRNDLIVSLLSTLAVVGAVVAIASLAHRLSDIKPMILAGIGIGLCGSQLATASELASYDGKNPDEVVRKWLKRIFPVVGALVGALGMFT